MEIAGDAEQRRRHGGDDIGDGLARAAALLVLAATLAGAVAAVSAPYLFSRAVDALARGPDTAAALHLLLLYAVLYGVARACGQAARFMAFLSAERLGVIANAAFFARLLRKTPAFFLDHNPAEVGSARQEGARTLNVVTQLAIGGLLPGAVQIGVGTALLGSLLNWETAAITSAFGSIPPPARDQPISLGRTGRCMRM